MILSLPCSPPCLMEKSHTGTTSRASGSEQQLNPLPTLMGFPACAGRTRRRSRRPSKAGARREVSGRHLKDMWASHHFWLNLRAVLFCLAPLLFCRRNGLKERSKRSEDIKRICGRICKIEPKHMQRLWAENRKGWAFIYLDLLGKLWICVFIVIISLIF